MSREVTYDGKRAFEIRFPFDRGLVDLVKTLPGRRWNASERVWTVPEQAAVALVDLLSGAGFRFDEATRSLYEALGGTATLNVMAPTPAAPPRIPGLFDDDGEMAETGAAEPGDYTVSGLNEDVRRVIESAFPQPIWLVGEISGFNRNAHKRHVSFQLAEHDENGKSVSSVDATLFEKTRAKIERDLAKAGGPFRLEDEIAVRLRARIELYVPWGSYRVIVEELDVNYTLGEAARRREEVIRRLTEQGLVGKNTSLTFPDLPLRVGLVTSLGSDAYNDVVRTLQESGYAFRITAHGARVQGRSTEPSVLNALDRLGSLADDLDVVIICRGGGARTDLAWFDTEALGRAVARFPLPVVIGIGHEQDYSVLDAVGRRSKTPTAAAAFLVQTVRDSLETLLAQGNTVLESAGQRIREESRHGAERARRLIFLARNRIERELSELEHRRLRSVRASRGNVATARERLSRWLRDIPRATGVHLARQKDHLANVRRAVGQSAGRDILSARVRLDRLAATLRPRSDRSFQRERERVEARERRLHLVDPRRVMERGYSILRMEGGPIITRATMAPAGISVLAELAEGRLKLRSEGGLSEDGGE